jgi:glycosyltransferase involved in cell wall biosynthesis
MRIVHLSTEDVSGGAARAAYRLHRGLQRLGHESFMMVRNRRSDDPTVLPYTPDAALPARVGRRLRLERLSWAFTRYQGSRPAGCEIFSDARSECRDDLVRQIPACDVINLHWIARYLDYETFFPVVSRHTPVVWRLADMNPMTGGCHVDEGCGRYKTGCGSCPQLGSSDSNDLSNRIWSHKERVFRAVGSAKLHLVALNRWMAGEVRHHPFLRRFPVTIIPNGVDTTFFKPADRNAARDALQLPRDTTVLLFVAVRPEIRYKGFPLLAKAFAALGQTENLVVVSAGIGKPQLDPQIRHVHLGYIGDDELLRHTYNAADLYLIPSLHDNSPNTVLEAMACGVPAIGFSVAGIPDMIRDGVSGLLVAQADVEGLSAAILDLVQNETRRKQMAENCRRIAV